MMLSLKISPRAVLYADTAVSLLENQLRELLSPEEFPTAQLELALKLQKEAKERDKEAKEKEKESKEKEKDALAATAPQQPSPARAGRALSKSDKLALKEGARFLSPSAAK